MLKSQVDSVYAERRKRLQLLDPDACFVFFGSESRIRNNNSHYPYRQNSFLYYLTEFTEEGAALVLMGGKSFLFVQNRVPEEELWTGERYGVDRAKNIFKVDEAYPYSDLEKKLEEWVGKSGKIYHSLGMSSDQDALVMKVIQRAKKHFGSGRFGHAQIQDPTALVAQLRMVKDPLELDRMRRTTQASVAAHIHLLNFTKPGMNEFDLQREFQYKALKNGCTDLGYQPIVAGGSNATTLHYIENNSQLLAGDLVLVDAGGEVDYYTADITQTFPVSAKFLDHQRNIYERVLEVNRSVISMMKPGITYRQMHAHSVQLITEHLLSLGLLTGTLEENIETKTYREFYPHGVGHHLGLDVHDAALYDERGKDFELKPGMILTVEPGLYFRKPKQPFFGIGIRIEDDVLITDSGSEVLTAGLPRSVADIESIRTKALSTD